MLKNLAYTASMGLLNGVGLPLVAHGQVIGVTLFFAVIMISFPPMTSYYCKVLPIGLP